MILVRALVLGEAGIAIDASDRTVDPRLRPYRRIDLAQTRTELADERDRRLEQVALVVLAVGVEPGLAVVLAERGQKALCFFWESVEADRGRHGP